MVFLMLVATSPQQYSLKITIPAKYLEKSSATILPPVRKRLRTFVEENGENQVKAEQNHILNFKLEYHVVVNSYSSLSVELEKAD